MSEEEIIDELERIVKFIDEHYRCYCDEKDRDCIQGLLDLYTKQKQYIDKLQKENKKYIDIFNSTEKIMNGQERTKDKLLKENVELQKENEELSQANMSLLEINQKLIEEKPMIKKLTEKELTLLEKIDKLQKDNISKDIIRNKIKELEEETIKIQEIMKEKHGVWNWNDTLIILDQQREVLKELLGE